MYLSVFKAYKIIDIIYPIYNKYQPNGDVTLMPACGITGIHGFIYFASTTHLGIILTISSDYNLALLFHGIQ